MRFAMQNRKTIAVRKKFDFAGFQLKDVDCARSRPGIGDEIDALRIRIELRARYPLKLLRKSGNRRNEAGAGTALQHNLRAGAVDRGHPNVADIGVTTVDEPIGKDVTRSLSVFNEDELPVIG